ncbi:MAG: hypothetical protein ACJ8F3_20455 [Xanthobacteraceae bacterium]
MVPAAQGATDLAARIEQIAFLVNADPVLLQRGRRLQIKLMIEVGDCAHCLAIERGRIVRVEPPPQDMRSWSFAIRGSEHAWRQFWQPLPAPHFHDLFALAKSGEFRIEGDLYPLMSNLFYFKGLLEAPRRLAGEAR